MSEKTNIKSNVTLESLDKKLDVLKRKIDIENKNNKNFFIASLLIALGFVIISIGIPILIQLVSNSEYNLWFTSISYLIIGIAILILAGKYLKKKGLYI